MFQERILKLNHLLPNELFKLEENTRELGVVKDHMLLWNVVVLKVQEGRDVDQP
jgi:hypothetical protein